MKNYASGLTPTRFRTLLVITMTILVIVGIGGFYLVQKSLSEYASSISQTVAEAEASENSINQLRQLESELKQYEAVNQRASSIVVDQASYQNQVISDINKYAEQAGITISQFSFTASGTPGAGAAAPVAEATPNPAQPSMPAASSQRTASFSITLNPPVSYTNLLRFIKSIEQNLPKMQISGLNLSPGSEGDTVTIDALTIEVYLR